MARLLQLNSTQLNKISFNNAFCEMPFLEISWKAFFAVKSGKKGGERGSFVFLQSLTHGPIMGLKNQRKENEK